MTSLSSIPARIKTELAAGFPYRKTDAIDSDHETRSQRLVKMSPHYSINKALQSNNGPKLIPGRALNTFSMN